MARRPSYVRVPGSDRLRTHKRGDSAAAGVERAPAASAARALVAAPAGAVQVGPALTLGPQVPLLVDVTDRLLPLLSAESAVVYVHLYRLELRDGKNAARVSLSELSRRTRLAGRRLNKAIADAVAAGVVVLVDRTRDGTLYRVVLPDELFGDAPAVVVAPSAPSASAPSEARAPKAVRATTTMRTPSAARAPGRREKATKPTSAAGGTAAPRPADTAAAPPAITTPNDASALRSVGDVCRWFVARHGTAKGRSAADVAEAVLVLLEEGRTFRELPELFDAFVGRAPASAPLADLRRYVA